MKFDQLEIGTANYNLFLNFFRGKEILFFVRLMLEDFDDTKGVIRIPISKKNRQRNGQKKKYKRTNNDRQNIHIKLTRTPLKTGGELMCSGRVRISCSISDTRRVNLGDKS